jgi:hypothetical protein
MKFLSGNKNNKHNEILRARIPSKNQLENKSFFTKSAMAKFWGLGKRI